MTAMKRTTRRQIEAALSTLGQVSETEEPSGSEQDAIGIVREMLNDILRARAFYLRSGDPS